MGDFSASAVDLRRSRGRPFQGRHCQESRVDCVPCAIGGTEDHLHLLTRLHPSTPVARLVAEVKGASSHLLTHRLAPGFSLGLLKATIPTSIRITEQSTTHS
ncbi:MAG: hypothetical protein E6J78_19375 [Deltaproteobacteria bacterium]|nr:MAG: hypothetical protein E6J78_19375 [Deltaproteobacteria bacterium]